MHCQGPRARDPSKYIHPPKKLNGAACATASLRLVVAAAASGQDERFARAFERTSFELDHFGRGARDFTVEVLACPSSVW